jgi:hypothetical protein
MKVTEEQRRALLDRLRTLLDEETATLLLEVTVPANVELATRGDIQELRAEMLLRFTDLDGRLTTQVTDLDRRLTTQMTDLDVRLTAQMTDLDGRLTTLDRRVSELGKELTDTLYRRVVPAIGVMLAIATWFNLVAG